MRKAEWFTMVVVAAFFATGAIFYPSLPPLVASHWDAAGNVNGYMARFWGVFAFPIAALFVVLIFLAIPRVDPRRENIAKFRKYFDHFTAGFVIFLYYIYLLTLIWNEGYRFNFTAFITPAIVALIYLIGILLPRTEPNFTVGIRTPWTISSPAVWKKTHDIGGIAFKMSAIIGLFGALFPRFALLFVLAPIVGSSVGLVIYSYVLYEREKKQG